MSVVIAKRPGIQDSAQMLPAKVNAGESASRTSLGIRVESIPPMRIAEGELGDVLGVTVIRVEAGSVADDAGLKVNHVIEAVNRKPIKNAADFKEAITSLNSGDPIVFQVYRQQRQYSRIFISLTKP